MKKVDTEKTINQSRNTNMKNPNKNSSQFMNTRDVMEYFNICRSTLYKWTIREKQLPYVRIGGKKLFKIDDINQLIEKNYTNS